jgi:signal transduction histidine kinase
MDSDQFNAAQTSLVSVSGYTLILSAVLAISSIIIIVIYSVESRIQRQAFREKQKLIRRLDEAYKMKSEFLSVVSHELRTPLTSILGALKLLASGRLGDVPEQVQRPLDIVHRNSQRLSALVNDILDFEKIESGNLSYNMGVVNVDSLVASAVEAGSLLGCSRGINVRVDNLSTGATVYGDENRLAQLLSNLISNAVKFSPDNSTVNVDVTHEDKVQISVTDEGPGIPESFENKVFERFTQAETGSARKFSGTGIGLNIAMAIAVAHKGKLFFKSKVGSGTTFFLELPQHGNLG